MPAWCKMENGYWKNVSSPGKAPHHDKIRGSFHLHFRYGECERAWNIIKNLTKLEKLGYMSSLSPNLMSGGSWVGQRTISVHTLHEEKKRVKAALKAAKLYKRIYKYNLIKKFRRDDNDDGSWVGKHKKSEESMSEEDGTSYNPIKRLRKYEEDDVPWKSENESEEDDVPWRSENESEEDDVPWRSENESEEDDVPWKSENESEESMCEEDEDDYDEDVSSDDDS